MPGGLEAISLSSMASLCMRKPASMDSATWMDWTFGRSLVRLRNISTQSRTSPADVSMVSFLTSSSSLPALPLSALAEAVEWVGSGALMMSLGVGCPLETRLRTSWVMARWKEVEMSGRFNLQRDTMVM